MAKESLFNILANRIDFENCEILDLFSGSGSIGYEFASRQSKKVVSVEKNYRYVQFIKATAKDFGFEQISTIKADVFKYLEKGLAKYDIVFADPPYALPELDTIPDLIFQHSLLKEDGILILEHPSNYSFAGHPKFIEVRNYSRVHFSFFGG